MCDGSVNSVPHWRFAFLVLVLCSRACGVPAGFLRLIPFLNTEDQYEYVVGGFNPTKNRTPTMLINMVISDPTEPRVLATIMVEEAQTNTCLTLLSSFLLF